MCKWVSGWRNPPPSLLLQGEGYEFQSIQCKNGWSMHSIQCKKAGLCTTGAGSWKKILICAHTLITYLPLGHSERLVLRIGLLAVANPIYVFRLGGIHVFRVVAADFHASAIVHTIVIHAPVINVLSGSRCMARPVKCRLGWQLGL